MKIKLRKEDSLVKSDVLMSRKKNGVGNEVLYGMCKKYFRHKIPDHILAKTILIGRAYAVALDRGKDRGKTDEEKLNEKLINDDFYLKEVVPLFQNSDIDKWIKKLKKNNNLRKAIDDVLSASFHLMDVLYDLNKQHKKSFCSKYLHFHLPDLFFILDSRAQMAINTIVVGQSPTNYPKEGKHYPTYANFFHKCLFLQEEINRKFSIKLTPRQIDNYLLVIANDALRNKVANKSLS